MCIFQVETVWKVTPVWAEAPVAILTGGCIDNVEKEGERVRSACHDDHESICADDDHYVTWWISDG